jgi:hypothetical protein
MEKMKHFFCGNYLATPRYLETPLEKPLLFLP